MLDELLERILATDDDPGIRHVGVGMLLAAAHNRSRQSMNDELRPLGIDVRQYAMLLALEMYGPSSQRRLIDLTGIDKSTMVRSVDELERADLVRRERIPEDRRAYAITLTRTGTQTLARARRVGADVGERLFGRLAADERDQLVALLRKISEYAG
ncbi:MULTISPECIES: MarR family winged helix-turn-helix transcriptional regulator [Actinomadura]|uniref:MarR family transcriptional regulator n=1 Tax=Actinomadura geliboluensis TaxID=882440 RepID=A0A5S4H272_9ACTN|nr:MarR family transcriptional regulator [Actinomadura geliboluensis]TMR38791.1 MarR family transcriptional regulator [Actinomadura geliboluensis]